MAEILPSSIEPLVRVTVENYRPEIGIMSDLTQVEMAQLNLAINARDAVAEGGERVIDVSHTCAGDDQETAHPWVVLHHILDAARGWAVA